MKTILQLVSLAGSAAVGRRREYLPNKTLPPVFAVGTKQKYKKEGKAPL